MNDSFFLTLAGCISLLLYICSLLLTVRFRGEFGVLADDASVDLDAVDDADLRTELQQSRAPSSASSSFSGELLDVFRVPLVDIRHMIALFPGKRKGPRDSALSARLFSLKVDVKDA
jgi:hypothetical protein